MSTKKPDNSSFAKAGKKWLKFIKTYSVSERETMWWNSYGNEFVRKLKAYGREATLLEGVALASGNLIKSGGSYEIPDQFAQQIVCGSQKNPECYVLSCRIVEDCISSGKLIPEPFRKFAVQVFKGIPKRPNASKGPRPENVLRDILIRQALVTVVPFGFKVARRGGRHSEDKVCGCSLVAEAFKRASLPEVSYDIIQNAFKKEKQELRYAWKASAIDLIHSNDQRSDISKGT